MPASSKMDPPLAKAKPISNSGSASGIVYVRGGAGLHNSNCCWRVEWEYVRAAALQTSQCRRRWCSRHQNRDSPAACGEAHGEAGCAPAAHGGLWWSRYPPAAHGRPHTKAGGCLRRLWPVGSLCWGRVLAGPVAPRREEPRLEQFAGRTCDPAMGPTLEQSVPEGLHPVEGTPHWSSLWRTAACGKDSGWRSSWRTVFHGRDPVLEQGKSVRSPSPEEEGTAETTCDELTAAPMPHPPAPLGKEAENLQVKLSLGRRERWGEGVKIRFYFSLAYSDLSGNKLISPSRVCFAHDGNCWVISLSLSPPVSFSLYFLSPVWLRRGVREQLW